MYNTHMDITIIIRKIQKPMYLTTERAPINIK